MTSPAEPPTGPAGTGAPQWREVWRSRRRQVSTATTLRELLDTDGYDNPFSAFTPEAWRAYVRRWATILDIGPRTSVFEVGCGAGAFLYELDRLGARVAGLDLSEELVACARVAIPDGEFIVGDASDLDTSAPFDVLVSSAVFMYFPDLDYAGRVLDAMVSKARHAVAILDLPDRHLDQAALQARAAACGGMAAYQAKYGRLPHLSYERSWFADALRQRGVRDVHVVTQELEGYGNASYRFNVWGRLGEPPHAQ